ncbi:MAG: NADH-quinone oxidoreductase subunit L [Ekhidna sp.]|uniref:NADH-quinone oxidoreductase subunit 5 family protein n=1 Tax=Ekhidna sp. TaxID=2608089 RepID=UPI0032EF7FAA
MSPIISIILVLLAPLIGGVLTFILKKSAVSIASLSIAFLTSMLLVFSSELVIAFEWLPGYELSLRIDAVASILIALVSFISLLVHVFSLEYMKEEQGKHRYFAKLGLFTFSMIGLLTADHLILLFVFWELVGLSSYLLIGFWYGKDGVPASARLAFMVNRVADVALLAGILILDFTGELSISAFDKQWLFLPSILIAIGAFGKSAQLPFSGWLTKAMVGPTPVSALIHAATMVTAGVYLLFRVAPFLHPAALMVIALVGILTAFYGALCALFQHDIKKVLAYSTISQLGYMVMGVGVGGADASLFHLFTHAFFKAGMFLGAGAIIHYLHQVSDKDPQDMRNMGGLRNLMPWTYRTFMMCGLALAGIPFFSGFMSKEGILIAGWAWAEQHGTWAYLVPDLGLITAFLTALYVGRMMLLVFWGEPRIAGFKTKFTEGFGFRIPLTILALGALWVFYSWSPFSHYSWLNALLPQGIEPVSDSASMIIMFLSILLALAGMVLAYSFFKPGSSYSSSYGKYEVERFRLALNGFLLVRSYEKIGSGIEQLSQSTFKVDQRVIDGTIHLLGVWTVVLSKIISLIDRFIVDGPIDLFGQISSFIGSRLASLSSRDSQTQLAWLVLGVILILTWILFL